MHASEDRGYLKPGYLRVWCREVPGAGVVGSSEPLACTSADTRKEEALGGVRARAA